MRGHASGRAHSSVGEVRLGKSDANGVAMPSVSRGARSVAGCCEVHATASALWASSRG